MKLTLRKGYVLIEWEWLVREWGRLSTGTDEAKALAVPPFLIVRSDAWDRPDFINHELIHFRQAYETFFVGLSLLSFFERLYARFVLRMDRFERYLYAAAEQEAYLHMHDETYLERRPWGHIWKHVRHKRAFKLIGPGQMEFLDEGRPERAVE